MMNETRRDLLQALGELSQQRPELRMGQIIANLATLARGPEVEGIWEAEDQELLEAALRQIEVIRLNRSAAA
jgi:hypothetical protein